MAATLTLRIFVVGLLLSLPLARARDSDDDGDSDDGDPDAQYDLDAKGADQVSQQSDGPQLPGPEGPEPQLLQKAKVWPWMERVAPAELAKPKKAAAAKPKKAPKSPEPADTLLNTKVDSMSPAGAAEHRAKMDAKNAKEAASVAKQAAAVANKVAKHSIKVTGHAKKALKHALGALHDARVESSHLAGHQKESLKKAEAHLREATKTAEYGKLKKVKEAQDLQKDKMQQHLDQNKGLSEREQMRQEIQGLRKQLREKNIDDTEIDKALDDLEADLENSKGPVNDESKAELERLRQLVDSLDAVEPKSTQTTDKKETDTKPLPEAEEIPTPIEEKGLDIDTQMPYGELEPFGREDTAQELTESSIKESDEMVDQLERAEVSEEKRAVFRALTRLRGAAITSFDGVARSQTGNIDEYNKIHQWRRTHPLHHLADEESDVSKWAFPENAD